MSISDKLKSIADNLVKLFEAGIKKGTDSRDELFRRAITANGERTNYAFAFRGCDFSGYRFSKPVSPGGKYSAEGMFKSYAGKTLPENIDLSGVPVSVTSTAMFAFSALEEVYDTNLPALNAYHNFFYNSAALKKIHILRVHRDSSFFQTFYGCSALEEIRFEGSIGKDISFSQCPCLSSETLLHIIGSLADCAESGETHTLALGGDNLAKLTDEQQQIALDKGWLIL